MFADSHLAFWSAHIVVLNNYVYALMLQNMHRKTFTVRQIIRENHKSCFAIYDICYGLVLYL